MCQEIYLSSKRKLPEVSWNEESPGFYLLKVEDQRILNMLKSILGSSFFYRALSYMGCSYGLCYTTSFIDDEIENYKQRVQDVNDFVNYLDTHKNDNKLQLFSSMWNEFPDNYPEKDFHTSEISDNEFYLDELVILNVV